jgi:hypothetical protein
VTAGTVTAGTVTFSLSGTGMHYGSRSRSGSGTSFGSRSIKNAVIKESKIKNESPSVWEIRCF